MLPLPPCQTRAPSGASTAKASTTFLAEVERACADGRSFDGAAFAALLTLAFTRYGLAPGALSRDEGISRGATARWGNGKAVPTAPTRKAVIGWVLDGLRRQAGRPAASR